MKSSLLENMGTYVACLFKGFGERNTVMVSDLPRLKSAYDFLGLLYCFIVLWHVCVFPWPCVMFFLLLWHDIAYSCSKCH